MKELEYSKLVQRKLITLSDKLKEEIGESKSRRIISAIKSNIIS